jgi:hypothetical protein
MKKICLALMLSVMMPGCGDPSAPAAPTPVAPTITETFTGTLTVLGTNMHPFTVQQRGGMKVTLTSLTPSTSVVIGVGTVVSGATCAVVTSVLAQPATTPHVSGTATIPGSFCVSLADNGALTESTVYTVTVTHS